MEIQIAFNEHDLYSNAAKGYASLTYNQKGQDLIERLIREVRIRALSENFVDIGVCGAIAPYNEILAGKLMALLLASKECHEAYSERYKNQISQISSQVAGKEKGKTVVTPDCPYMPSCYYGMGRSLSDVEGNYSE